MAAAPSGGGGPPPTVVARLHTITATGVAAAVALFDRHLGQKAPIWDRFGGPPPAGSAALALCTSIGLGAGIFLSAIWSSWKKSRKEPRLSLPVPRRRRASSGVRGTTGLDGTPVPARPVHAPLRPGADPRIDTAAIARYDPDPLIKTGAIIIVVPGGNYDECGIAGNEGQGIAQWLVKMGITAVVLQYRCVSDGHYWPAQYEDWKECARLVRRQAKSWGCDPKRVGVAGFSAGGHLAAYASNCADPTLRPALQVLVYPAIDTMTPREDGAIEPWRPELGYPAPETSPHLHVNPKTPPAFLAGITTDEYCPAHENTDIYAEALKKHGVEHEYVTDELSEHGCGLQEWWTDSCATWLAQRGWAKKEQAP